MCYDIFKNYDELIENLHDYRDTESQENAVYNMTILIKSSYRQIVTRDMMQTPLDMTLWHNEARVICMQTDEELAPYLPRLLHWIRDLKQPGAKLIYKRLLQMPQEIVIPRLNDALRWAHNDDDPYWELSLNRLRRDMGIS